MWSRDRRERERGNTNKRKKQCFCSLPSYWGISMQGHLGTFRTEPPFKNARRRQRLHPQRRKSRDSGSRTTFAPRHPDVDSTVYTYFGSLQADKPSSPSLIQTICYNLEYSYAVRLKTLAGISQRRNITATSCFCSRIETKSFPSFQPKYLIRAQPRNWWRPTMRI